MAMRGMLICALEGEIRTYCDSDAAPPARWPRRPPPNPPRRPSPAAVPGFEVPDSGFDAAGLCEPLEFCEPREPSEPEPSEPNDPLEPNEPEPSEPNAPLAPSEPLLPRPPRPPPAPPARMIGSPLRRPAAPVVTTRSPIATPSRISVRSLPSMPIFTG